MFFTFLGFLKPCVENEGRKTPPEIEVLLTSDFVRLSQHNALSVVASHAAAT